MLIKKLLFRLPFVRTDIIIRILPVLYNLYTMLIRAGIPEIRIIEVKYVVENLFPNIKILTAMSHLKGLYTCRAIVVEEPIKLAEIGIESDKGIDEIQKELRLRMDRLLDEANKFKDEVCKFVRKVEEEARMLFGTKHAEVFLEELVHWHLINETFTIALIEAYAWRERLDAMYAMELLYTKVGEKIRSDLNRIGIVIKNIRNLEDSNFEGLEHEEVISLINVVRSELEKLADDKNYCGAIQDLIFVHDFLKGFLGSFVIPIIECATWYIIQTCKKGSVDEALESLTINIDSYYHENIFNDAANHLANDLLRLLMEKHPLPDKFQSAIKIALDLPMIESQQKTMDGSAKDQDLWEKFRLKFLNRLENSLIGIKIPRASKWEKSLLFVMGYALNNKRVDGFADLFAEILKDENEISNFILERLTLFGRRAAGTYLSAFLKIENNNKQELVVYDPLSGLTSKEKSILGRIRVQRSGRTFSTLEDLVGDLPLVMRALAGILLRNVEKEDLLAFAKTLASFTGINETKIINVIKGFEKINAPKVRDLLLDEFNKEIILKFTECFLYLVLRLGKDATKLSGLHALWYL